MSPTVEFAIFFIGLPALFAAMMVAERVWPRRIYPPRPGWHLVGALFFVMVYAVSIASSLLIPEDFLRRHRLLPGEELGVAGGIVALFTVYSLAHYAYHYACHRFDPMWRVLHQWHHAVPRVDVAASYWGHPLDHFVFITGSNVFKLFILGLDPMAVAIGGVIEFFYTTVSHWNVRTPRWLGWVMLRPEEHVLHHERRRHAGNYGGVPWWDWLFGTYRPAVPHDVPVGFDVEPDLRTQWAMFLFRDVNASPAGSAPVARAGAPKTP